MKHILPLLIILLSTSLSMAQNDSYENLWKTVEQHESKGLAKSAYDVVKTIKTKASNDNNSQQLIKSMLYQSKFALVLEEDAQLSIINEFKYQIKISASPTKNILENLLAELYWQYFKQHRRQFYSRSKTSEKVNAEDFRTWDLQTLFNEVHLHFQNALLNPQMLQHIDLKDYSSLLNNQKESKKHRPTLYDFLSHNALEFYKTNETHINKPAYKFEIDNPDYLCDAGTFSDLKITSKDTMSLQLHALKIYHSLIQFHLKDKAPVALADVNIERLKFVNQHAVFTDRSSLLLETLISESEALKPHEVSGLYDFEVASLLYDQSKSYQPKSNIENRWKAKEAVMICDKIVSTFPNSKGAKKALAFKSEIEKTSLQITTEQFLPIQKHGRLLIQYKNINSLQFNIYKLSDTQFNQFRKLYRKEEQQTFILGLKPYETWESPLKNENDYQRHSTEIVIPKLDNGRYLVVVTLGENNDNTFAFSSIQVTNMALVETETKQSKIFQIIDRNNGDPIVDADIKLSYSKPNQKNVSKNYTSNNLGQIEIEKNGSWYSNVRFNVKKGNDRSYFGDFYVNRLNLEVEDHVKYKSFLFTDRSIYRPGQTVYFKGIAMASKKGKSEILAKEKVAVALYNVNNEKIKELKLITNDYGSISGTFILPNSGLNGRYHIEFQAASRSKDFFTEHYFSVEEYKRPKFEAKFQPVTKTIKVNDSVTIKGIALAYAGSNISDAKVVYRVHRKVELPQWYYWNRPWINLETQEITHGENTTNEKGEFSVYFKAIPDQNTDKKNLPVFHYEVTADVTDINGETQSASILVKVGYHSLTAKMNLDEKLNKTNKEHTISLDTRNLNGAFVPANGLIKIYKLKAPDHVLRRRPWAAPDYQVISKEDFKRLFPNDPYGEMQNNRIQEKGKLVLERAFNTETSKTFKLGNIKKWESGAYLITLESKDRFGQLVKDQITTTLYSDKDKKPADNNLFTISTDKPTYNIGDTASITFGASAQDLTVTISIEKNKKIIKTETIILNGNKQVIRIPVSPSDLGGFAVHYSFAAFNSYQSGTQTIAVPYPKSNLSIETVTFRDKLQPRTDETWQFKIKGFQGDSISAELLASMYDASLDQFKPHQWRFNPLMNTSFFSQSGNSAHHSFGTKNFRVHHSRVNFNLPQQYYDQWNWFGLNFGFSNTLSIRGYSSAAKSLSGGTPGIAITEDSISAEDNITFDSRDELDEDALEGYGTMNKKEITGSSNEVSKGPLNSEDTPNFNTIKIRKNLQETAFFFPQLKTDKEGNVSFSFKSPEALTKWKVQLLAHTKTLGNASKTLTTVTQKELMVIPNTPRFLREGDSITISSKIANLTENQLTGQAHLVLTDAISGKVLSQKLISDSDNSQSLEQLAKPERRFTVDANGNTQISWKLYIPVGIDAIKYKVIAKSGDFSDGEQNILPVLSNRILVTETLPMWIRSNQTKTFSLDKLKTNTSSTLKHHKLTLEMTSNPAWFAVQALPYLMEYPYACNEQTFSRYYANALASHIANSNPRIQDVFSQWASQDILISNLEKNEELKSILIQEIPWLRNAQSETEQKKRIGLLFNLNKMNSALQSDFNKLAANQMNSGGWAWFNGGRDNRYITQHIINGFGHLKQLGITQNNVETDMIAKAIDYLDKEFVKTYKNLRKHNKEIDLEKDHLSYLQLHYLYTRSFYPNIKKSEQVETIIKYYHTQIQKYWLNHPLYSKGLMALVSHRNNDSKTAMKILRSLKDTSITSEELGMYWKSNTNTWHWYQAPIETQALLIETFSEIENDTKTIDNLKIWLLKNKQTNQWKTTKGTTEAIYALLLQGSNWLSVTEMVDVVIGGQNIDPVKLEDVKIEAGTGYYKIPWDASEIRPEMAEVTLTKKGDGIAWGSLYWQYLEDLDNISAAETPLKLKKNLFLKTNTDTGEEITEITSDTRLNVGDLVRVRIELRSDRNMEFLHMKDMRASGLEPINVISKYKWQDGLGYYESTKDASTNFFFDYLPKGVYVFEYDLRINNAGHMSNGITTIQSMYAPEFSSHSEGARIKIDN
ncbi:alpha-2-macroglobulin family protein [Algibacter mikhailovii]|nr:MG2 domain-containing protein [Algibacter mikhailovii]